MTAAMQLQEGCHRLAGVLPLPLQAAGLLPSQAGCLLLHEVPAVWDTRHMRMACKQRDVSASWHAAS